MITCDVTKAHSFARKFVNYELLFILLYVSMEKTSWLPSKKESNTWGAIFANPYNYEYKMSGN